MVSEVSDRPYVIDAHSLYWYWENPSRLSLTANAVFASMERGEAAGLIPAIVVAEINYFSAKLRAPMTVDRITRQIDQAPAWRLEPLTRPHLLASDQLTAIPEMHDRLIAAVALVEDATILTRDPQLLSHPLVRAVW
jgi:PIN domain nuclease of toxin-antitoxin system